MTTTKNSIQSSSATTTTTFETKKKKIMMLTSKKRRRKSTCSSIDNNKSRAAATTQAKLARRLLQFALCALKLSTVCSLVNERTFSAHDSLFSNSIVSSASAAAAIEPANNEKPFGEFCSYTSVKEKEKKREKKQ